MMKKKTLNVILGIALIVIWGPVFYKIYDAYSGNNEEVALPAPGYKEKAYNDFGIKKDTNRLQLNYRDPFKLSAQFVKDTIRTVIAPKKPKLSVARPAINWAFVKYSGYIANPVTKKVLSMLIINGKSFMLAEGETAEQVRLVKNKRDSVEILYNHKIKFISKNTTAI